MQQQLLPKNILDILACGHFSPWHLECMAVLQHRGDSDYMLLMFELGF